jgi:zinc transport system substrate-binding protein
MRLTPILALAAALAAAPAVQAEVPEVVTSIKPIHALVATVMGDLGTPQLIVKGTASPHTYSLKPSDAEALEAADLVFWTGHGLELFLSDALSALATEARIVELSEAAGLELLPVREGGAFAAHAHEEEHGDEAEHEHAHEDEHAEHDHAHAEHDDHEGHEAEEHNEADMHFWLDPENAKLMLDAIAAALTETDPANAGAYAANAEAGKAELETLRADIAATLVPLGDKSFIVFHDAYQYFERRFGLHVSGSITVTPDTMPGARRIGELRQRIAEAGVACVFAEPQFEPTIIAAIIEGSGARAGILDPEAAGLEPGPGLYRALLESLATGLKDCLEGN